MSDVNIKKFTWFSREIAKKMALKLQIQNQMATRLFCDFIDRGSRNPWLEVPHVQEYFLLGLYQVASLSVNELMISFSSSKLYLELNTLM